MSYRRRGISILELLVIMSASTVVLTLSCLLIIRAMRAQMDSRAHCDVERSALRLAQQFRDDVHQAQNAETNEDAGEGGVFLRLGVRDGKQVEYSRTRDTVLRLTSADGNQGWREEFAFPATCEISIRELESPPRIALKITTPPTAALSENKPPVSTLAIPVSFDVEAALDRDRRFAANKPEGTNP
jgi:hypothetical protein